MSLFGEMKRLFENANDNLFIFRILLTFFIAISLEEMPQRLGLDYGQYGSKMHIS